jgi:ParB family chromosome partitioning protein
MKNRNQKLLQKPAQKSSKARGSECQSETGIVQSLPLNQLHASLLNVRKTGGQKIEDLAASIKADGLIHNLTVIATTTGKTPRFEVVAGGRRLKALRLLVKQKVYTADQPIACRIVAAEQATGVSLAENVIREAMHPADQFDAFRKLVDEGKSQTDIAGRFGISTAVVRDRLALARVAPEVVTLYRANGLTLDQVMAFTVSSDHDQHRALLANQRIPSAWEIKRQLLAGAISGTDRRAVYVGKKAYEAAGGNVRKDLFAAANDEAIYFEDGALLERLAVAKLEHEAEAIRARWAWVEIRTELDYTERAKCGSVPTVTRAPTSEQAATLATLQATREGACEALEAFEQLSESDADEDSDATWQALDDAVESAEAALQAARAALEQPDTNAAAFAGAIVTLTHEGTVQIVAGLVRPEDKAKLNAGTKQAAGRAAATTADDAPSDPLPVRLGLSALRTAVAQDAIAENTDAALRMLAFALAQTTIRMTRCAGLYGLNVRGTDKSDLNGACEGLATSPIGQRNAERAAMWEADLPDDDEALWAWCLAADDHTIRSLLAYCTARTLDGVQRFPASRDAIGPVALALGIDMADHWQPTPAYFVKVKKADTLAALAGADGKAPAALAKLKREPLAEEAAKRLAGTRWLPPTLRQNVQAVMHG